MKKSTLLLTASILCCLFCAQLKAQGNYDRTYWKATASMAEGENVPQHIIDGDRYSRWTSGQAQTGGEWIAVDMFRAQTFNRIIIDNDESANDYPRGYEIYVSDDGDNWGDVVMSGNGTPGLTIINLPVALTAQHVKIVQTGSVDEFVWWTIKELYIENTQGESGIKKVNDRPVTIAAKEGQILFQGVSFPAKVEIHNLSGQKVKTASLRQNTLNVDLNTGIYIINIESGHHSYSQKIIIR